MRRLCLVLLVLGLSAALPLTSASATIVTRENTAPIVIPDVGAASPYPSPIAVSGVVGPVQDVNATIRNFSHTCSADVDILLVGPGGQKTILFSDAGSDCSPGAVNVTITFDDQAAASYPCNANPSGSFKPTDDPGLPESSCGPDVDSFDPPAPGGPFPVSLAAFNGADPNGSWNLFVRDDASGDSGTIGGGWSLTVDTPPQTTITKQPPNKSTRNKVKYEFTSDEPGSSFECLLPSKKRKSFTPCVSPFKAKVADGKHKFLVRAKDSQGAVDATPVKDKFKVLD